VKPVSVADIQQDEGTNDDGQEITSEVAFGAGRRNLQTINKIEFKVLVGFLLQITTTSAFWEWPSSLPNGSSSLTETTSSRTVVDSSEMSGIKSRR